MEKEIQAETRKAEEAQRRQRVQQEKANAKENEQEQQNDDERNKPDQSDRSPSSGGGHDRGVDKAAPAKKVRVVKMTPAQKRDLTKLIGAYLAEHPDQGGKAIDQVQSELRSQ
ncbi:MAG TPA: hypothetical protein VFH68_20145 [Polyangia bacterium]|nr:hypothetical protein [Polyangia bacterium]